MTHDAAPPLSPTAVSILGLDRAVWRALVALGVGAVAIAAAWQPDSVLVGSGANLIPMAAALPAALWAFVRGPRQRPSLLLYAAAAGFLLTPLSWASAWWVYGDGASFTDWFEGVTGAMQLVETRKVLGVRVSETVSEGVPLEFFVSGAIGAMFAFALLSCGPLFRRRCGSCARPSAGMVVGQLPFVHAEPILETGGAAVRRWIDDPSIALEALYPLDPAASVMVELRRCPHCGDSRAGGYVFVGGVKRGVASELKLTLAERAAVEARLAAASAGAEAAV